MFRRLATAALVVGILCFGITSAALAETGGKPTDFHLYKASALSSMRVYNPAGEDLGKISDLVMTEDGRILYGALLYGGVAGVGSKYFAVPLDALALHQKDKTLYFVLNMDKARLENATGFKADDWPNEPDRSFSTAPKAGEGKAEETVRKTKETAQDVKDAVKTAVDAKREIFRTSGIIGTKVKNENGDELGKISDLVFDTKKGQVAYTVLAYGGVAGIGAKQFAVAWDAYKLESANLKVGDRVFVCNIDKATLENSPGFGDSWPHEADKRFTKKGSK